MAQPTTGQVHLDAILTNMSVAFLQQAKNYIAGQVFPQVMVQKQTDKYYIFDQASFLQDTAKLRAPSTESEGSGYTLSKDSYSCDVFAIHKDISDQIRANTDNPLDPDRNATQWLTQQMLTRQEIQFISDFIKTGVWGTDKTGGSDFAVWSDQTASDPVNDVEDGKEAILKATGFEANTMVVGYDVFRKLKTHPDIKDQYKYTTDQVVTEQMLAALFGVERFLVAKAIKNTAEEGQTGAYDFTFGKSALLCYSAPAAGLEVPSAGYQFIWQGVSEGMGAQIGVARIPMPALRSDRVEAQMAWDNKLVAASMGYFYSGAVA